jgi:intracellular septation protein A
VKLSRGASVFLLAVAVWNWIIWPTFLRNIWADDRSFDDGPTSFLLVHLVLVVVSLVIGTALGVLGWRGLRVQAPPS